MANSERNIMTGDGDKDDRSSSTGPGGTDDSTGEESPRDNNDGNEEGTQGPAERGDAPDDGGETTSGGRPADHAEGGEVNRGDDTGDQNREVGDGGAPVTGLLGLSTDRWVDDDQPPVDRDRLRRLLTYVLAFFVAVSLVGVAFVALTPDQRSDSFTEFYITGPAGNASDYPTDLTTGETGEFVVGLHNQEGQSQEYTVVAVLNGTRYDSRSVVVGAGETWEEQFSVTVTEPGRQRLQVLLYRGSDADVSEEPYRLTRLWITVSTPQGNRSEALAP